MVNVVSGLGGDPSEGLAAPGPFLPLSGGTPSPITGNIVLAAGGSIGSNQGTGGVTQNILIPNSNHAVTFKATGTAYLDNTVAVQNLTYTASAVITGYIIGTALTVSSVVSGSVATNQWVVGNSALLGNTQISSGSGTSWVVTKSQTVGSLASPVTMTLSTQLGNSSIRFLDQAGDELGAIFVAPQLNSDIAIEGGSIVGNDTGGRGFGFKLTYATGGTGPMPDGTGLYPLFITNVGDVKFHTTNGVTNTDVLHQVCHVMMKGGTGATQGFLGIGASAPSGSPSLAPLFPLHLMGKQLLVDSDGLGTNSLWLNDDGTFPVIGTNQAFLRFSTGSNTPGSATEQLSLIPAGFRFGTTTTATVTISLASPGVVTWTAHGQIANTPLLFRTAVGATLPAAITAGTTYYIKTVLDANTFSISAAPTGTAINTATASTGTITAVVVNNPTITQSSTVATNSLAISSKASTALLIVNTLSDSNGALVNPVYLKVANWESGGPVNLAAYGGVTPGTATTGTGINLQLNGQGGGFVDMSLSPIIYKVAVSTKATNYTVTTSDVGKHFDNIGAAGEVDFALPAAATGLNYTFTVFAAQILKVIANGTDKIAIAASNSAAGGNIQNNALYSSVTIKAHGTGQWVAQCSTGSWTVT